MKNIISLKLAPILIAAFFVVAIPAQAAVSKSDYKGQIVAKSAETLALKPGQTVTYELKVKNIGSTTWTNSGSRFVSIYTYFPKYRPTVFYDKSWYRKDQPTRIKETSVKPGEVATIEFKLTAPDKVGTYEEGFNVGAEDFTWIPGTQLKIPITVSVEAKPPQASAPEVSPQTPGPLAATILIKSFQERVTLSGGERGNIMIGFKNTGTVKWQTRILRTRSLAIADSSSQLISFADSTWPNTQEVSRIREPISPGNVAFFQFNVLAPDKRGDYTLPLKLVIDDIDVPGMTIDIPITVTEDAPQLPMANIPATSGPDEPIIRVGLWNVPGGVTLLNSSAFTVIGSNGAQLTSVPAGRAITVGFNRQTREAVVSTPNGQFTSLPPVRFVPNDPNGLFQVPNFEGWEATAYVNQFRGTMELNYYAPNDNVWLIEELPLEQYMRGLAETSNSSPYEYQKALVIAARTYAYYVISIGGKYDPFHVKPSAADQVYRAYGSETIRPNLVRAVEETRGQMVTYQNEVVVTPYFSRSDGRTRAWEEVWCCQVKPWLKSVPAPHDVGKTLWGHGVGMSALDALGWANDGKTYDWILKYFYSGIELKRIY